MKRKDLARALSFLKSIETSPPSSTDQLSIFSRPERDWEILDTCLNADDLRLVSSAYFYLKERDFLPNFGKFSRIGNWFFSFN